MFPRFLLILAVCLPAALPQSAPDRGAAVFRTNCAFCHGLTGQGGRGPDLTRKEKVHGNTAEAIRDVIQHGVPGTTMPAFSRMDKQDLAALVAYVMAFSERSGPEEKVTGEAHAASEDDLERVLRHPAVMVGSDSSIVTGHPHPRTRGNVP